MLTPTWRAHGACSILASAQGPFLGALLQSLPEPFGVGVDISAAACAIARNNLAANGFAERSQIVCANWTAPLRGPYDIIVSNPPYIRGGDIVALCAGGAPP